LAGLLYEQAERSASALCQNPAPREVHEYKSSLVDCVFDLMLLSCFGEVLDYCHDNEVASFFVDAVLYQATGREPGVPTESEILAEGTQRVHGIGKYQIRRDYVKMRGDVDGWTFGKEYAALRGAELEFSHIVSVQPFTLLMRGRAKWVVRYCLYGTLPTESEEAALKALVDKYWNGLKKLKTDG